MFPSYEKKRGSSLFSPHLPGTFPPQKRRHSITGQDQTSDITVEISLKVKQGRHHLLGTRWGQDGDKMGTNCKVGVVEAPSSIPACMRHTGRFLRGCRLYSEGSFTKPSTYWSLSLLFFGLVSHWVHVPAAPLLLLHSIGRGQHVRMLDPIRECMVVTALDAC